MLERFGLPEDELISQLKFEAVMVISDIFSYEMNMQLILDVLMSTDGRINSALRTKSDPQSVPLYFTNPDL